MFHDLQSGAQGSGLAAKVIHVEQVWRQRPERDAPTVQHAQVTISRWTDPKAGRRFLDSTVEPDHHLLSLTLRPADISVTVDGQRRFSGRVRTGALQIAAPGQSVRAEFLGPSDTLHLYLPSKVLSDCYGAMHGRGFGEPITLIDPWFTQDQAIELLGRQLLAADDLDGPHGRLCADGLLLAVVARLLNAHANCGPTPSSASTQGLSKWRLKRARDFIEANLGESIHLSDIAASTGLSRMHFAAQFRAATGLRPHDFVLRCRIERAQELIAAPNATLVDVALSVGFQTQAHFTTVFKRLVGETPSRWRQFQAMPRQRAA